VPRRLVESVQDRGGKALDGTSSASEHQRADPTLAQRRAGLIPTPYMIATVQRLGERAGRQFLDTGIWAGNPFRTPGLEPLAAVWHRDVSAVVGPPLRPR
jgi:hypothetical protein